MLATAAATGPSSGSIAPPPEVPSATPVVPALDHGFACATVFLRSVADYQKARLRMVERYDREFRMQKIGGQVSMAEFVEFGRQLADLLRANPNGGRYDYYMDLATEIGRLRSTQAQFEEYGNDSQPIPALDGFWELVEELAARCEGSRADS